MALIHPIAAVAALVFGFPFAATWHPAVPLALRLISGVLLIASLYRPGWGLLVVAGLVPLGMLISAVSNAPFGSVEAIEMLIAPVALGCTLRVLITRKPSPDGTLLWPAVVMAAIVGASLIVQLAQQRDPTAAFGTWFAEFCRHVTWTYFIDGPIYPPLHRAYAWIWGLGLAVLSERFLRDSVEDRLSMTRMTLVGGVAAGVFALVRIAEFALRSPDHWSAVWHAFATLRISPHIDPNAAGSFYVMLAVPAVFWALTTRWWWSLIAAPPLLAALWLTRSRTALIVFVFAVVVAWMISRHWSWRRLAIAATCGAAGLAILAAIGFGREHAAEPAMRFRMDMAIVSLELASSHPMFGIGLDEFQAASVPLITPEAIARFPPAARGENAHNNFLQILVELGAVGLAAFLWMIASPVVVFASAQRAATDPIAIGTAAGVLAFLLTCLAGHPLLVPQAALPFCLMLGLFAAAARAPVTPHARTRSRWTAAVALVLIAIAAIVRLPSTI